MSLADKFKEEGNAFFKEGKWGDAIGRYSKAIQHDSSNSILFCNRALAYIKMKEFDKAVLDGEKCVELDGSRFKNRFVFAQALEGVGRLQGAKKQLELAFPLASVQDKASMPTVELMFARVKKAVWDEKELARSEQLNEHHRFLAKLIENHYDVLEAEQQQQQQESHVIAQLKQERSQKLQDTLALYRKVEEAYKPKTIPDHLCCKISYDIMRDPVITPSGITYDRVFVVQHLHRIGNTDPLTRQPLTEQQLIPNFAIRDAIEEFIKENPWAENLDMS